MNRSRYADDEEEDELARYGGDELVSEAEGRTERGEGERDDDDEQDEQDDDEEANSTSARTRKYLALRPPIASLCTALGGVEEFKDDDGQVYSAYSLGDQVVGCLKDLKRFWRMDEKDDDRTVARIFHDVGLLKNDLVPILLTTLGTGAKGDRIALACVELIGAMTWPIDVVAELQEAKTHDELKKSQDYTSLISAQLEYKSIVLRNGILRAMFQLMSPSLAKTRRDRTTKDENVISLILHTFRNLVALVDRPTTSESAEAIELATLQSGLIVQMHDEGIFDLLVAIAHNSNSSEYAPWNMVVLDILHLVFRCVRPQELMVASSKITENRLKDLLDLEGMQKKAVARMGNSRHSRFGTTVALQSNGHQYIMHKQSTLSRGAEQTLDQIKKSKATKYRPDDDLAPPSSLQPSAIKSLRLVALSFIDSAFNPFFSSVLKDIRMERIKVKETDTVRFLVLSRFFLEFFLLVYADERKRGVDPQSEEGHDFDLIAEMTETQSIAFVTQRMKVALEEKPPLWMDLHAGIECFTQILLTIEALTASGVQDHIDIAEILQNKLYYEAETLDMVLTVITRYNTQSHKYLDSVINLAYVLLRMLEKYSKSKAFMYVRKKRARQSRKKKGKKKDGDVEDELGLGGGNEEEDEVDRSVVSFGEHAFEFTKFEEKFAEEGVLQTCMIYLESYKSFKDPDQLKRIVSLMHRQAIKAKSEGLFYKPSVLELFRRILEDDSTRVARDQATTDLKKLIDYILKKFFKAVMEKPLLLLECFFPKTKSQLGKMRTGEVDPYASSDDEFGTGFKFKIPGEVEVTPGFTLTQQIGIATACLVDTGDLPLVHFVLSQLALASAARTEIVLSTDGVQSSADAEDDDSDEAIRRRAAALKGPSSAALEKFVPHELVFEEDSRQKEEVTRNANLKLLMRLLNWESRENVDSTELIWTIPTSLLPATLDGDKHTIENFLIDPVDPDGKTAADYLRKKRKPAQRRERREDTPEYDDDGNLIEPVKKVTKRVKKRKEEVMAYKSAQFIDDSDDDEEADRAFFAKEAELRAKLAAGEIASTSATGGTKVKASKKKASEGKSTKVTKRGKKSKELKTMQSVDVSDESDLDEERLGNLRREARTEKEDAVAGASSDSDEDEEMDDDDEAVQTPTSSTVASRKERSTSASSVAPPPASEHVSSDKRAFSESEDEEDGERPAPTIVKKRKVILDSEDEDD